MKRTFTAIIAGTLTVSATAHAQVTMPESQPTGNPIVLWPSVEDVPPNTEGLEGWTFNPQQGTDNERWTLPPGWPAPAGWSPEQPPPPPQTWPEPEDWPEAEDWEQARGSMMLVPMVVRGATKLVVWVFGYVTVTGACWDGGQAYTEGRRLNGQRCVCEDKFTSFIRECRWRDIPPE